MPSREDIVGNRRAEMEERREQRMNEMVARVINRRGGKIPEPLLRHLSTTIDEELYGRLKKANDEGKLKEAIRKEGKLNKVTELLD